MNDKSPDIISPRADTEPPEVLQARELAQFRLLVLAEAKRAAKLEAGQQRYRQLKRDIRSLKSHLENVEAEAKEIEARHPRHLLTIE